LVAFFREFSWKITTDGNSVMKIFTENCEYQPLVSVNFSRKIMTFLADWLLIWAVTRQFADKPTRVSQVAGWSTGASQLDEAFDLKFALNNRYKGNLQQISLLNTSTSRWDYWVRVRFWFSFSVPI